jgi:hypothetical protein
LSLKKLVKTMWQKIHPGLIGVLLASAMIAGCELFSAKAPYAQDPLLVSRKPVQGNPEGSEPVRFALAQPAPPPLPAEAFVFDQPTSRLLPRPGSLALLAESRNPNAPAQISESLQPPSLAPAMQPRQPNAVVEATPVARTKHPPLYGHAPDYSWLQGRLEQAEGSHVVLRFAVPAAESEWGGRISLENDAHLVQFRPGDVIRVTGQVLGRETAKPSYQIREIWLLQRPN